MKDKVGDMCTICGERNRDNVVVFRCPKPTCAYNVCVDCLRTALVVGTSQNDSHCPSCKNTVKVVCPKMTEKAAENKDTLLARHDQCKALKEVTAEARKVYKKIAEEVLLKCPHCKLERGAYDGTIALPCKCGAAFCAKCLINCADIHQHVKQHHGGPSATDMPSASKILRIEGIVRSHLRRIAKGSGELIQLVNNHLQNAGHLQNKIPVDTRSRLTQQFLVKATSDLDSAVLNDRLSLLSQPGRVKGPLTMSMISPRNSIQSGYRVRLTIDNEGNSYLSLYKEQGTEWVEIPLEGTEDEPLVDSLVNLKGSFRCGVIAISGEPCLYQTRIENHVICFHRVASSGHVGRACSLSGDHIVLALNSNKRITSLQTHAKTFPARKLMLDPILHLIGAGNPQALLDAIASPVPQTVFELNEQQRCVAHPLRVKTAMEVAGPPGTGKTKTITELTRSLLECTKYNIIVFSERNGAIDAIAEKIFQTTMTSTGAIESQTQHIDVHDLEMWTHVLTFGSKGMGHHTKLFSLPTKIEYHPAFAPLRTTQSQLWKLSSQLATQQLTFLTQRMLQKVPEMNGDDENRQSRRRSKDLQRPTMVIDYITATLQHVEETLVLGRDNFTEEIIDRLADITELITFFVLPKRTENERKKSPDGWKTAQEVARTERSLTILQALLRDVLLDVLFSREPAQKVVSEALTMDIIVQECEVALTIEMIAKSRLHMCTIGSSHRLPCAPDFDHEPELAAEDLRDTVVIFDEGGCIPSYELFGLSRLGCKIVSLIIVGDVHQLPPYCPGSGNWNNKGKTTKSPEKLDSILDVCALSSSEAKVFLTRQYRVPRDIADLLNRHIYKGKYETPVPASVPEVGFNFVHIPLIQVVDEKQKQTYKDRHLKYVNHGEIEAALEIISKSQTEGHSSIIVLTPYKKQQREMQSRLKKEADKRHIQVLTIDQCQGQEADVVILSLVQKPTMFLNRNRLNVALSRVRKMFYLLVDKDQFQQASNSKSSWECKLLARDLLALIEQDV